MTPAESLSLAARIRLEVERLGQQGVRASATFGQASSIQDRERALELAAYEMATYYSGLERVFEAIANDVDRAPVSGPSWHQELLDRMRVPLKGRRPPVIGPATGRSLDGLLRFRHVMRSIYAFELDFRRITEVGELFSASSADVESELIAFADFLDRLTGEAA